MGERGGGGGCAMGVAALLVVSMIAGVALLGLVSMGAGAAVFLLQRPMPVAPEEEIPLAFATPEPGEIEAVPSEAEAPPAEEPDPGTDEEEGGEAPVAEPAPAGAPKPAPASPSPSPSPSPAPKPAPAPAPTGPSSVPNDVIAATLQNSVPAKRCFVPLYKAGTLPKRVDVRLTIQPNGTVSAASVESPNNLGAEFDACMAAAVRGTTYPGFSGSPQTLIFPFQLG